MFLTLLVIGGLYALNYAFLASLITALLAFFTLGTFLHSFHELKTSLKPVINFKFFFINLIIVGIYLVIYLKHYSYFHFIPLLTLQLVSLGFSFLFYKFASFSKVSKSKEDEFIDSLKK